MTDEERLVEVTRLAEKKRLEKAAYDAGELVVYGHPPRSCWECRWKVSGGECSNPAASLKGAVIRHHKIRTETGLCGPNGIFWELREPRKKKRVPGFDGYDWVILIALISVLLVAFW